MKTKFNLLLLSVVLVICLIGLGVLISAANTTDSNAVKKTFSNLPVIVATEEIPADISLVLYIKQIPPFIYIALGDSVSSGYGLLGYPHNPQGRHSTIFFEQLKRGDYVREYINLAQSGLTTSMLLELLDNLSEEELAFFQNARIITLNIGGNNILRPFIDYFAELQVIAGAENIGDGASGVWAGAWGILSELATTAENAASDPAGAELDLGNITAGLGNIWAGLGGLIGGTGELIVGAPGIISTWRGALSPELEAKLEAGVNDFNSEFTQIITWLETNAPRATIIVNTVYNPIPPEILITSVPIANWADELITAMNTTIVAEGAARGYLVADIYPYFSRQLDLMQFNLNPREGGFSLDLVHPNAAGHYLLARLYYAIFRQYLY